MYMHMEVSKHQGPKMDPKTVGLLLQGRPQEVLADKLWRVTFVSIIPAAWPSQAARPAAAAGGRARARHRGVGGWEAETRRSLGLSWS